MRKRPIEIKFRVSEQELAVLNNRLAESGLSRNDYLIKLILNNTVFPKQELIKMNLSLEQQNRQLRGLATNINQIARIANSNKSLPSVSQLEFMRMDIYQMKLELQNIWTKVRQMIYGNSEDNIAWKE